MSFALYNASCSCISLGWDIYLSNRQCPYRLPSHARDQRLFSLTLNEIHDESEESGKIASSFPRTLTMADHQRGPVEPWRILCWRMGWSTATAVSPSGRLYPRYFGFFLWALPLISRGWKLFRFDAGGCVGQTAQCSSKHHGLVHSFMRRNIESLQKNTGLS